MPPSRSARPRKPLDAGALEALALSYVGRFATTRHRLIAYLERKVRERGWGDDTAPPLAAIADRCVEARYVDDAGFAAARASSLLRRGYGRRRVAQSLRAAGIEEEIAARCAPTADDAVAAAESYARRRRFGRFGDAAVDRTERHRQFGAMLRAGHDYEIARLFLVDPDSERDGPAR